MPCYHPITGYRVEGGQVKHPLGFSASSPGLEVTISCGNCIGCVTQRKVDWSIRGIHELAMSYDLVVLDLLPTACFITLTYSDENLPENGQLSKKDWQLFAKKLRQAVCPFRFLMCGEYGSADNTERCHFHAILFGIDFLFDRTPSHKTPEGHQLFISPTLDRVWDKGLHQIGSVSHDSISYVAGYINKKARYEQKRRHYERTNEATGEVYDQVPEFGLMSRRPGLGTTWIQKFHTDVYPRDEVIIDGHPATPPAFYDRWYAERFPELWEPILEKRKTKAIEWAKINTPEVLARRERAFKARNRVYLEQKGIKKHAQSHL